METPEAKRVADRDALMPYMQKFSVKKLMQTRGDMKGKS